MTTYKKGSAEYLENGYYRINNKEYMSIWTFKNHNLITPNNNKVNGEEGKKLVSSGVEYFISAPDFGPFREIKIYSMDGLKEMYSTY